MAIIYSVVIMYRPPSPSGGNLKENPAFWCQDSLPTRSLLPRPSSRKLVFSGFVCDGPGEQSQIPPLSCLPVQVLGLRRVILY